MIFIDEQLQAGEDEMLSSSMRLQDLIEVRSSLDEWQRQSEKGDPTIPLDANQRASLSALVAFPAEFTPAWMNALEGMPPAEAPLREYQDWIGQIQRVVQLEINSLNRRLRQLDADQIELAQSYSIESKASRGFSPNIIIDRKEDLEARQIRPTSVFVLVGGIVGLLIGLLIQLIMILPPWKRN